MATEVFKIVNDMSPEYIKDIITIQNSSYNFRRENQASIPQVNFYAVWAKVIPL